MKLFTTDFNESLEKGKLKIRAIHHPLRKKILSILDEEKEIKVTDLYIKMRLEQSITSQHLSILRNAGFVSTRRNGKEIFYKVNHKEIDRFSKALNILLDQ